MRMLHAFRVNLQDDSFLAQFIFEKFWDDLVDPDD